MPKFSLGDRLVSAAVSAVFGAIIGCVLAWLFGVYSSTMGSAGSLVDFRQWVLWSALVFGLIGLLLGSHAATIVGMVISGIFQFERAPASGPRWLVVAVFVVAFGVWWWLAR